MDSLTDLIEMSKRVVKEWVTTSRKVSDGPLLLYSVAAGIIWSETERITIVDGVNETGEKVLDATNYYCCLQPLTFDPPLYLAHGLYITLGAAYLGVLVRYIPLKP